jgi:NDP-sugar pyrophosphorylase family protein
MSGIGKRFMEAGYSTPKPLIMVEGKPIIQHIVEKFDPQNDEFIFICNDIHLKETNMRSILENICTHKTIVQIPREKLGPVWAVMQVTEYFTDEEPCIVNYCDFNWQWDYIHFKNTVAANACDGSVISYIGFHPHLLGPNTYASMRHEDNWMLEIKEKHSFTPNKMNCYQSSGTYYFSKGEYIKKYFQQLMDKKVDLSGEYYVSLVYNELQEAGLKTYIYEIPTFMQWGTPDDLQEYIYWSDYFNLKK